MNVHSILEKFGDAYTADENTFVMGICRPFTMHFAERFIGRNVLETCTGAGFTTISLARTASQITTIDIDPKNQQQAIANVERAGCSGVVSFILGDVMREDLIGKNQSFDAAFLDPDWAVSGPNHEFRFLDSNTKPPADRLLDRVFRITRNVALVLPPLINVSELAVLPVHERESLYLNGNHELYCLYFGDLIVSPGQSEFRVAV